jgi:hypothetical protein
MDWEEVKDLKTLSKVKSVEEMLPKPAANQTFKKTPTIWEDEYRIIEECLMMDCTVEEAITTAWISYNSFINHKNKNPDFALRVERAKQFPKMIARAAVQRRIRQWDAKTALEFLKLRDKKRYNAAPWLNDEWEIESTAPVVQFTSVPSDEWADQWKNDSQKSTNISSASDTSATSSEPLTPRENEDEALRRLAS